MIVSPSILSADFAHLADVVKMLDSSNAEWLHMDVMDGVFVPNISFGFPVMKSLRGLTAKPFDVHLMIVEPVKYVNQVKESGADYMTVHYEACTDVKETIRQVKLAGLKVGVSIKPDTPVRALADIITELDLVLLMSVYPGFSGQKFIPETVDKLHELRALINESGSHAIIEVDGGVNDTTGRLLAQAGADAVVAGNYVFKAQNPLEAIDTLKAL